MANKLPALKYPNMCLIAEKPEDRIPVNAFAPFNAPSVYPSVWFAAEANAGRKPQITMPATGENRSLAAMRASISQRVVANTLSLAECMLYLELAIANRPETLTENWTSFGRTIGARGEPVSLTSLYERVNSDAPINLLVGGNVTERDDLWLLIIIVSIYRVCNIDRADHRQRVCNEINARLRSLGGPANIDISVVCFNCIGWGRDLSFCALIACIDMYMVKLPRHPLAEIRIGTKTSRFRDCSAITDLTFLCETLNADFTEVAAWMWSKNLNDDFKRVRHQGEEVDKPDSYTPYLRDLRLSPKSPYSTKSNPHLHFWIHIIGVCLGSTRSQNSRIVGDINIAGLSQMGMICGYAYLSRSEAADGTDPPRQPNSLCGDEWYDWYKDAKFEVPDVVNRLMSGIWGRLNQTRERTIGRYAKTYTFRKD